MSDCQRCGLCCKGIGDMYLREPDYGDCPWLEFDNKGLATCTVERDYGRAEKPRECRDYPFPDIDGGKCHREIAKEARKGQMALFGESS